MDTPESIAAYHRNQPKEKGLYFVCLDCGKEFDVPQMHKSCDDACHKRWEQGHKYSICQKCGKSKELSRKGLCLDCYIRTNQRNEYLIKQYQRKTK